MKEYRIEKSLIVEPNSNQFMTVYDVQVKWFWFWITIKSFADIEDEEYASMCAVELVEKLTETY